MRKIYQKMYPSAKNRSKDVLGGFMDKVILRSRNSGSRPFENIKRSGCRVKASRHDDIIRGCRVKASRHDANILRCRVKTFRHDDIINIENINNNNTNRVILRSCNSGSQPHCANRTGFTLIELLVVVLIIGILAAVALPQYEKVVFKSRATQALVAFDALIKAEQIYYMANGSYDTTMEAMDIELPDFKEAIYQCSTAGCTLLYEPIYLQWLPGNSTCVKICNARPKDDEAKHFCASLGEFYEEGVVGSQGYWNRYCMEK